MRIIYMGSPDFAVPCLEILLQSSHEVVAVITQPDRPKGRGKKLTSTPVKEKALEHGIEVWQPEKVNTPEFIRKIRDAAPDLIIVVAFGQILKQELLDIPPFGCVNVHASLLPKYRGAAPIHWSIIDGEKETGVTTMWMDAGMDTGDMILLDKIAIDPKDTMGTLHDKLAEAGAKLLEKTVELISQNKAPRIPQDSELATYASLLKREHEMIDWGKNACEVSNHVRGMNPWPGAYTTLDDRIVKIWQAEIIDEDSEGTPGSVLSVDKGIKVQCQKGSLSLIVVQPQGKRKMSGDDFARGYRVSPGDMMGNRS